MDKSIDLQVVITAVDEASSKLESIGKTAGALGKQFTIAGGLLAGALGLAVKQASDAQIAIAKVDATLSTMGQAGLKAREGILKAGEATQKLGFDNEEASVSIAKFFQRTGDLTTAIKLNALAMDLARAKSIDLTTASTLVGQVLAGNGKVLKAYGIDIKESATPLEALGELQAKVANQATGFAKTFAGASAILKQNVDDLTKKIGAQLLPVLTQFIQKATPVIEKITNWASAHPQLTQNIVLATSALAGLLLVLGPVLVAISMISAPMIIAGTVIGLLAVGLFQLIQNWQAVKTTMEPVLAQIQTMAQVVGDFLKPAVDFLVVALQLLWVQLKVLWDLVSPVLIPTLQLLAILLGGTIVGAIAIFIGAIGVIALVIAGFINGLKMLSDKLAEIIYWFQVAIPEALAFLSNAWSTSWNAIKGVTDTVIAGITASIEAVISAWNRAKELVSTPIKAVSGAVSSVVKAVTGKKAGGGVVEAGQSYLVGERGAEIFSPSGSGFITPNNKIGGGGITVNINGGTYLSESVAEDIGDLIIQRFKKVAKLSF